MKRDTAHKNGFPGNGAVPAEVTKRKAVGGVLVPRIPQGGYIE